MAQRMSPNPPVFDGTAERTLCLHEPLLLALVQACKQPDTLPALRQAVAALKQRLGDPRDALHASGDADPIVTFDADYLLTDLDQIADAQSIERARYYIDRLLKSVREVRTSAVNDINLNRWKEYEDIYTDSLWQIERRDRSGVHTAGYWGNFIPQIPYQMMRRYTKPGDWVIDTFAGSGTTLIEGQRLGRHTLGIELQPRMVAHAGALIAAEPNPHGVVAAVAQADCTTADYGALLQQHGAASAQLVVVHPPYFDIIKFSDDPRDLSNAPSVTAFLALIGALIDNVAPVLDQGRYLALVIGDKYVKGDWIPLGFQTMNEVMQRGFSLKSIIVKNFEDTAAKRNQKELWRYRALVGGFYVFKHEYIFVFKKQ